jgi:serine/threonine protein kinase/tetratricopeptide (TPR) repeat protein
MADQLDRLKAALANHYRIERELGSGGMATVYLAQDLKHERQVAVKVLRPEVVAALGSERFLREIKIAANLSHPHILPLHDSGEADGFLYYVMPCVEGGSLRDRLNREKQLPIEDALEIIKEIGDALSHAHSVGFVHRDIKPENILFEAGHAVVSDFGIARAVTEASDERLTDTGLAVGTPAYMSPEQGTGEQQLDGRSDIYSLGCVLYEMLGGDPPYTGSTPQAILARKMTDPVPSLKVVRETVPAVVEYALTKALAKAPSDRFATATQFVEALETGEVVPPLHATTVRRHRGVVGWIGAAIATLAILGGVALLGSWSKVPFSERDWIVIADLENSTGDSVFDQSLNAALTVAVQQSRYVNVLSVARIQQTLERMGRDSISALTETLAREVAVRENATVVVVPSISRIDSIYSLAIRVLDPATGDNLASRSVRAMGKGDVLQALDRLAHRLRRDLGESRLAVARRDKPLPKSTTTSLDALKALAQGLRPDLPLQRSGELWLRAIELDSNFASAHSALGYYYLWALNDRIKSDEHFDKALSLIDRVTYRERLLIEANVAHWRGNREEAANKFQVYLAEYPDDSQVWFQLGYSLMLLHRGPEALAAFERVLELEPSRASAYINIATIHINEGRRAEAVPYYLRAFELEPDNRMVPNVNREFGLNYVALGELDKAEEAFTMMLSGTQGQRAQGARSLGLLRMYEGKYAAAIRYLQQATAISKALNAPVSEMIDRRYLVTALQGKGATADLERELAAAYDVFRSEYLAPSWLVYWVTLYARSGRLEQALEMLDTIAGRVNSDNTGDRAAHHRALGEIALARGEFTAATDHFEVAVALFENDYNREPLALCALASGDIELGRQRYEQLVERKRFGSGEMVEPWVLAHYQLGKIYEQQGDTARALERYSQFVDIWKDGDNDLPPLIDARRRIRELAGLEG